MDCFLCRRPTNAPTTSLRRLPIGRAVGGLVDALHEWRRARPAIPRRPADASWRRDDAAGATGHADDATGRDASWWARWTADAADDGRAANATHDGR